MVISEMTTTREILQENKVADQHFGQTVQCSATEPPRHQQREQETELCSRKMLSAGLMTALYCNGVLQLQTCFT